MESHITEIARVIQLSVAPVFLLTAIGTIIGALNNRLGRVVDRRRVVKERLHSLDEEAAKAAKDELGLLARRARLIYHAIFAAVTALRSWSASSWQARSSARSPYSRWRAWLRSSSSWR